MDSAMESMNKKGDWNGSDCNDKIGALCKSGISKIANEVTRQEWSKILSPFQFTVLREGHTERAGTGAYVKTKDDGVYHCYACGAVLFKSDAKFESRCGWPSFSKPESESNGSSNVGTKKDYSYGLERVELYCVQCNSHLGHLFEDGISIKKRERYCVNSAALEFVPSGTHEKK